MGKISIIGNPNPEIGIPQPYNIFKAFELSSVQSPAFGKSSEVAHWEIWVLERGNWRKTDGNAKTGEKVEYTFNQKSLTRKGIKIIVTKGSEKAEIAIRTQPAKKPKINKIELLDSNGDRVIKPLSYVDTLTAKAYCTDMEGEFLHFTLWEDDAKGAGHNTINQVNKINPIPQRGIVKKGIAKVSFDMTKYVLASRIANMQVAKGDEGEGKTHEYYVTTEYYGKLEASNNVNLKNPDYSSRQKVESRKAQVGHQPKKNLPAKPTVIPKQPNKKPVIATPAPKKETPKYPVGNARTKAPDRSGNIISVEIKDKSQNPITKNPKFGEGIFVLIKTKNVINKHYKINVWEDDTIGKHDLLFTAILKISDDLQWVYVPLTRQMQQKGEIGNDRNKPDSGEYSMEFTDHQEIFVEIEFADISMKSSTVTVDANAAYKVPEKSRSVAVVKGGNTESNITECFCKKKENRFYWSDKLTCEQRKKVLQVCSELWGEKDKAQKASELMSIMHLETKATFDPAKKGISNGGTKYIGLVQFSATTATSIGTSYEALGKMIFTDQMNYVGKYIKQNKNKLKTIVDFYLQVLKPNAVGHGAEPNYIVFDESIPVPDIDGSNTPKAQRDKNITKEPWVTKYGYASNPLFMKEEGERTKRRKWVYTKQQYVERYGLNNGKTYVWEIEQVLKEEHYSPGKVFVFNGECINMPQKKNGTKVKRAPWMEVAINVAKQMKGCTEDKNPMYNNAKKYLRYCSNSFEPTDGENGPWCAAFMNWSINETSYSNANSAASLAPLDAVAGKKYKQIEEPIYGCIVVYKHKTKWKGHTGFLFGMTKSGKYILIGGNQDNTIRFDDYGEYTSNSKSKKLYGFYIPLDYKPTSADDLTDSDIYNTSNEINIKYGIVAGEAQGKTN